MVREVPMPAAKVAATAPAMAGSVGTTIPEITAAAIRAGAMAVVVTAGAEVTAAEVVGIETQTLARLIYSAAASLDSFQCEPSISLELLQNAAFPVASGCIPCAH